MSGNPHHAPYKRGQQLARELQRFVERELADDREAVGHALRGAYDYLDTRTRLLRGESPWPVEPGPAPPDDREN